MKFTTLIVGGIIILMSLVVLIILLIFLYQKRYYRHLRETEKLRAEFARETLKAQLEIQEQTLQNIAQEIHDNVGQALSLAKLNLNTLDISKLSELDEKVTNTKDLIGKAIVDLRDLSRSLNTDAIKSIGLARAIENELDMIRKSCGCDAQLKLDGKPTHLDKQQELILFRIIQESLQNIIKHADAKNIRVTVQYTDTALALKIEDDGKGFDVNTAYNNTDSKLGMGLRNMQNRARLIKADFAVTSELNKGTSIKMELPLILN